MAKKIIIGVVALLIVVGALVGIKVAQVKAMIAAGASMVMPPETVTAEQVTEQTWQPTLTSIGSIAAVQGVILSAEMPGAVRKISFESGAEVKQGDILVELDSDAEKAQLQAAEATAGLAGINLKRARELRESNTNSQAELDAVEAQTKDSVAQLENIRAVLAKKVIRAPFSGRAGIRQINLGQYLEAGKPIVSLQVLDPIYVDFYLPQQVLGQLATDLTVRTTTDAYPGETFEGKLTAINPDIDSATRNVRIQATLPNPKGLLRPGLFANVVVALPVTNKVLVIPATSILYAPYGDSVYVIEDKKDEKTGKVAKVARQQFVRLGQSRGDFIEVVSGVKAGETVVTNGAFKLRNGSAVVIDNTLAPKNELAPKPNDT